MALAPVHPQRQLQPGARRPQLHVQPQGAAATDTAPQQARTQRTLLGQLGLRLPMQRQRPGAVIGRDVPGIPELAVIGPAAPGQRPTELRHAIGAPELLHTAGSQLRPQQAVAQQPTMLTALQLHGLLHRQGCGGRQARIRGAAERHGSQAGRDRQLHPGATPGCRLLAQRGGDARHAPRPPRQPQRAMASLLELQLQQPPAVMAGEQTLQGTVAGGRGLATGTAPLGLRLLEHLRDRRAGKDVVELLKQQRAPVGRGFRAGVGAQ